MDNPRGKGLGRGIASLISIKKEAEVSVAAASKSGFLMVSLSEIQANPYQPRRFFNQEKIEELAASIREKGVLQPLIVTRKNGQYELIAGERRFRAAALAELKEVPVIIREIEPRESLELAMIENIQREDLNPLEEAKAYQELIDRFGYTQEEVARKVSKGRATVSNMLRLLKLPTKAREALQAGWISIGHARALLGVDELERQIYFVDRIIAESWSVRELEVRITSGHLAGGARLRRKRDRQPLAPKVVQMLDDLRRRLGTQVRVVPSGKKGKIIIEYYSEVDLDRVYSALIQ